MARPTNFILKTCPVCGTEYKTYLGREKQTCSRKCMGISRTGENNPNYGNTWSLEQRKHLSDYQLSIKEKLSERVTKHWENNEERREKASKRMSETMSNLFKTNPEIWNKHHSEESKILIGKKSKEKFTPEFKATHKETMIKRGYWIDPSKKDPYILYREEADWVQKMWDIVDSELIKEHGIFNPLTNSKGCVRDHMYGRINGFKNNVPPILLRHPANCQIILNTENVKKAHTGDSSITLEQLLNNIKEYKHPWIEQAECLDAIKNYTEKGDPFHAVLFHF